MPTTSDYDPVKKTLTLVKDIKEREKRRQKMEDAVYGKSPWDPKGSLGS